MVESNAVEALTKALSQDPQNTNNTYTAVVSRIDNEQIVWVQIAGSDKETPTASTSAEVKQGDVVTVEWRNNKLYIAGNTSNPSAGIIRVDAVERASETARLAAETAVGYSNEAKEAAEQATTTANSIREIAEKAETSANAASESAEAAKTSADNAFKNLSFIEDIMGVLDLVAQNGQYELTNDEIAQEGKWYFTRSGEDPNYEYAVVSGEINFDYILTRDTEINTEKSYFTRSGSGTTEDPYVYTEVENPDIEDIGSYYEYTNSPSMHGFYELVGINEAIQNYVSSHLVLMNDGLHLRTNGTDAEVVISSEGGVIIKDAQGEPMAQYGNEAIIGNVNDFHIQIDGSEIGFYEADLKVAYVNNNQLYITQSVVLQEMAVGTPIEDGGLGQWSWKIHVNAYEQNNLCLKWLG